MDGITNLITKSINNRAPAFLLTTRQMRMKYEVAEIISVTRMILTSPTPDPYSDDAKCKE